MVLKQNVSTSSTETESWTGYHKALPAAGSEVGFGSGLALWKLGPTPHSAACIDLQASFVSSSPVALQRGEEGEKEKEGRGVGETAGECAHSSWRHPCLRDFFADSQRQPSPGLPVASCRLLLRPDGITRCLCSMVSALPILTLHEPWF
ncbi:Epiplakin [Manis pentadactyla]|nr:Epiplakin [Manis pentadactyla]